MKNRMKRLGLLFLLLSLFSGAVVAPTPAYAAFSVTDSGLLAAIQKVWAERSKYWGETIGVLQDILGVTGEIFNAINFYMDKLSTEINKASGMRTAGYQGMIEAETRLAQARADAVAERNYVEAAADIRMQHFQPANQQLCNTVVAQRGIPTTKGFRSGVSSFASSAVETMYRGEKDNGDGPQYAAESLYAAKKLGVMSTLDGVTQGADKTTKGTDGRSLQGQHISASVLDGGQVLEIPMTKSFKQDGIEMVELDPQTPEQKFWTAGLYYCMNLMGPRPTPPTKDEIATPGGMTRRTQWNNCAAAESAMMRACTNLLAFYTRPNSTFAKLREEQKKSYEAVKKLGVTMSDAFGNGEKGLSPYQEINATQAICKSNQYYVAMKEAGASEADLMASISRCTASWNAWQGLQQRMKNALTKATAASEKLSKCWAGTGRQ